MNRILELEHEIRLLNAWINESVYLAVKYQRIKEYKIRLLRQYIDSLLNV